MSTSIEPINDGTVLNLINKRLRALRKKLNRITQMEESMSQGKKTLNKEQEDTLRSKPSVIASIDELEKLRQPLSQAVAQEIELALVKESKESNEMNESDVVADVLKLLYFGCVFDVKSLMSARENLLTRIHERSCCLTYDYVTDDDDSEMLRELDLDLISGVGGKLVSRAVDSGLSHEKALEECVERAKLWLGRSEEAVEPGSSVTYAGLREKLNKIMASEYFTTTPEIKAPTEVAAAGGDYTSFPMPVYGSVDSSANLDVSVESSVTEYQPEEEPLDAHGKEIYDEQPGTVEEHQQGGSDAGNVSEQPAQTELGIKDTEESRDVDSKEEQTYPDRKPYQNNRGGRGSNRRGYSNGSGGRGVSRGGGYQNGRSGQLYDQPGSGGYYPRNQNYRGRGGKSMGGNNNYRDNDGHATYAQEGS